MSIAGRTYDSHAFESVNHGNVAMAAHDSNSVGGHSQVRIENDIKEMQSFLPPLLDTASTKKFLDNDEIQHESRNLNQSSANHKQDSIPLKYIRDNSKLSDSKKQMMEQALKREIKHITKGAFHSNTRLPKREGTISPS